MNSIESGLSASVSTVSERRVSARRSGIRLAALYFLLALCGLIGTWYYNLKFVRTGAGEGYLSAWFANAASASAAVDLFVLLAVAAVFFVLEGHRLGWRWYSTLLFIPLSIFVALSFTVPLFLGLRELRLAHDKNH